MPAYCDDSLYLKQKKKLNDDVEAFSKAMDN